MLQNKLEVELFWPPLSEKDKFKGEANSISSENKMGEFDILPRHANFITLISNSLTIHTVNEEKKTFKFSRGVLEVAENQVKIFLEV